MSERKTAEIKFRCTPSFKAGLAASAAAAEQSMSEYIESAVWARQNAALFTPIAEGSVISTVIDGGKDDGSILAPRVVLDKTAKAMKPYGDALERFNESVAKLPPVTSEDNPDAEAARCDHTCKPWEFCACKANA